MLDDERQVSALLQTPSELALVAGGKSYDGRMTSEAQAASPLPGVSLDSRFMPQDKTAGFFQSGSARR